MQEASQLKNLRRTSRTRASLFVEMKAMRVNPSTPGPVLIAADLPQPRPAEGELLIRVCAAGVTPTELLWYPTTQTKDGTPRKDAVPGHEFSGVVAGLGKNTTGLPTAQPPSSA
jgi:NADPH:quinone reductase-like Zn-dependent oxidoreductase